MPGGACACADGAPTAVPRVQRGKPVTSETTLPMSLCAPGAISLGFLRPEGEFGLRFAAWVFPEYGPNKLQCVVPNWMLFGRKKQLQTDVNSRGHEYGWTLKVLRKITVTWCDDIEKLYSCVFED